MQSQKIAMRTKQNEGKKILHDERSQVSISRLIFYCSCIEKSRIRDLNQNECLQKVEQERRRGKVRDSLPVGYPVREGLIAWAEHMQGLSARTTRRQICGKARDLERWWWWWCCWKLCTSGYLFLRAFLVTLGDVRHRTSILLNVPSSKFARERRLFTWQNSQNLLPSLRCFSR